MTFPSSHRKDETTISTHPHFSIAFHSRKFDSPACSPRMSGTYFTFFNFFFFCIICYRLRDSKFIFTLLYLYVHKLRPWGKRLNKQNLLWNFEESAKISWTSRWTEASSLIFVFDDVLQIHTSYRRSVSSFWTFVRLQWLFRYPLPSFDVLNSSSAKT